MDRNPSASIVSLHGGVNSLSENLQLQDESQNFPCCLNAPRRSNVRLFFENCGFQFQLSDHFGTLIRFAIRLNNPERTDALCIQIRKYLRLRNLATQQGLTTYVIPTCQLAVQSTDRDVDEIAELRPAKKGNAHEQCDSGRARRVASLTVLLKRGPDFPRSSSFRRNCPAWKPHVHLHSIRGTQAVADFRRNLVAAAAVALPTLIFDGLSLG